MEIRAGIDKYWILTAGQLWPINVLIDDLIYDWKSPALVIKNSFLQVPKVDCQMLSRQSCSEVPSRNCQQKARRVCSLIPKIHTKEVSDRQCSTHQKNVCQPISKQVNSRSDWFYAAIVRRSVVIVIVNYSFYRSWFTSLILGPFFLYRFVSLWMNFPFHRILLHTLSWYSSFGF